MARRHSRTIRPGPRRPVQPEPESEIFVGGTAFPPCRSARPATESIFAVRHDQADSRRFRKAEAPPTCRKHVQGNGAPLLPTPQPPADRRRRPPPALPRGRRSILRGRVGPRWDSRAARGAVTSRTTRHHAAWGTSICRTVATSCSLSKPALISSKPILRSISRSTGSRP